MGNEPAPLKFVLLVRSVSLKEIFYIRKKGNIHGPFAKFVDSPYYSESELSGGAVTVSSSKYLPW
jgi:hypothetical protein